jgi:hypothetical protein
MTDPQRTTITVEVVTYGPRAPWESTVFCAQVFDPTDHADAMPVAEAWHDDPNTAARAALGMVDILAQVAG